MKPILIIATAFILLSPVVGYSEEYGSFYFAGFVSHFKPSPQTHEGNMSYLGYSKEYKINDWRFDTGISTFIDSYSKRSYSVFSDVSHEQYAYRYFRPLIGFNCSYKGTNYDTREMGVYCLPLFKLRVGESDGLFAKITPIPRVRHHTNGYIAVEIGYKW